MRKIIFITCSLFALNSQAAPLTWKQAQVLIELEAFKSGKLGYDYRTVLYNRARRPVDTLSGRLVHDGARVYDSNSRELTIIGSELTLKVDLQRRQAIYSRLDAGKRNRGQAASEIIPDAVIEKYGKLKLDTSATDGSGTLSVRLPEHLFAVNDFIFRFDRKTRTVLSIQFSAPRDGGEAVFFFDHIRLAEAAPRAESYVAGTAGRLRLRAPYQLYSIREIR